MKEWGVIQMDQHKFKKEEKDLIDRTAPSAGELQHALDQVCGIKTKTDMEKFNKAIELLKLWMKENGL